MKSILMVTLLLSSVIGHARTVKKGDELMNYTCKSSGSSYSLKVTSNTNMIVQEKVKIPATLIIKRIVPKGSEVKIIPKVFVGHYEYEDVVNTFLSSDRQTELTLYADELDQTVLESVANGKTSRISFDCN